MFSTLRKTNFNLSVESISLSANALNLDQSKIFSFGKEFKVFNFQPVQASCSVDSEKTQSNEIHKLFYLTGLIHYQTTNIRLFQTERVCRQQFQI